MAKKPDKTGQKTNTKFKPGKSGNPAGRPLGSKNKATIAMQAFLKGEADTLTRKCVEMAMDGDTTAMRLCLERIVPPCKELPLEVKLPSITSSEKLAKATAKIIREVAAGNLTPSQGEAMTRLLGHHQKALELADLDQRIKALEDAMENGR